VDNRADRAGDSGVTSPSMPIRVNLNDLVRPRVPTWVILVGCLSVFLCVILCGTAVGVWIYVIKNGYVFGKTPVDANPPVNGPPVTVRLGPPGGGVAVNGRLAEPEGGFSYVPPDGWIVHPFPGLKYRIVAGPIEGGFAPNINVVDQLFAGSLEEYVGANLDALQQFLAEFRIVKQEDFQTTDGLQGVRVITYANHNGRTLRQTYYLFGNGNTKYVVTCTSRSEGGEELDPIFEASMKTFRVEQP
jgi:hypothetical protein